MATYVPGTMETDKKKLVRSLQQLGPGLDTANTNITTNTTNIASNTTAITALQTAGTGLTNVAGSLAVLLSKITASLGADVALNNISNYFDGPSVAQGSSGTWFVSGTVSVIDTTAAAGMRFRLWDGTTIIASAIATTPGANQRLAVSLSGFITSPVGNLRISVKDTASTSGSITFNGSGDSKDSTISAIRIA